MKKSKKLIEEAKKFLEESGLKDKVDIKEEELLYLMEGMKIAVDTKVKQEVKKLEKKYKKLLEKKEKEIEEIKNNNIDDGFVKQLEENIQRLSEENKKLIEENKELKKKVNKKDYSKDIADILNKNKTVVEETEKVIETTNEMVKLVEKVKQELVNSLVEKESEEIKKLKEEIEALKSENELLNEQLKNLEEEKDKLVQEMEEAKKKEVLNKLIYENRQYLDEDDINFIYDIYSDIPDFENAIAKIEKYIAKRKTVSESVRRTVVPERILERKGVKTQTKEISPQKFTDGDDVPRDLMSKWLNLVNE